MARTYRPLIRFQRDEQRQNTGEEEVRGGEGEEVRGEEETWGGVSKKT